MSQDHVDDMNEVVDNDEQGSQHFSISFPQNIIDFVRSENSSVVRSRLLARLLEMVRSELVTYLPNEPVHLANYLDHYDEIQTKKRELAQTEAFNNFQQGMQAILPLLLGKDSDQQATARMAKMMQMFPHATQSSSEQPSTVSSQRQAHPVTPASQVATTSKAQTKVKPQSSPATNTPKKQTPSSERKAVNSAAASQSQAHVATSSAPQDDSQENSAIAKDIPTTQQPKQPVVADKSGANPNVMPPKTSPSADQQTPATTPTKGETPAPSTNDILNNEQDDFTDIQNYDAAQELADEQAELESDAENEQAAEDAPQMDSTDDYITRFLKGDQP